MNSFSLTSFYKETALESTILDSTHPHQSTEPSYPVPLQLISSPKRNQNCLLPRRCNQIPKVKVDSEGGKVSDESMEKYEKKSCEFYVVEGPAWFLSSKDCGFAAVFD
jgi:hypothetical protein